MANQQKKVSKFKVGDVVQVTSALQIAVIKFQDDFGMFLDSSERQLAGEVVYVTNVIQTTDGYGYIVRYDDSDRFIRGRYLMKKGERLPSPKKLLKYKFLYVEDEIMEPSLNAIASRVACQKDFLYNGDLSPLRDKLETFFRFNEFLRSLPVISVLSMGVCRETDREFCNMFGWGELREELIRISCNIQ